MRAEFDRGEHNALVAGDDMYFVMERGTDVHVITSACPHRGGPLHLGEVEDDRLRCPWHGSFFPVGRLCDRAHPSVRVGDAVTVYLPATDHSPVPVHTMVRAGVNAA
ncbi:Rieske (2Fe-2S) protein [Streptomyces smaragdinus]|uniref:Rieske (2Fe-2S) protein n=1 Tax=Streptomyces smaragdinus TaxID=2585196 RepID=UPI0018865C0A|nr:Rieske (2Fe-2S) protein [Streptomyces smaragdinus]